VIHRRIYAGKQKQNAIAAKVHLSKNSYLLDTCCSLLYIAQYKSEVRAMADTIYTLRATDNAGNDVSFDTMEGKLILIVNTASKCGFTPQYEGLQELYKKYNSKGLEVIAFPCDQFAHQEPGDDEAIKDFCSVNYGVTFPIMKKIEVNGTGTHPVFAWLKQKAPGVMGGGIKWNFTKFLVSRDGKSVTRYAPTVKPADLKDAIEKALQ